MNEASSTSITRLVRDEQGQIIWWLPLFVIVFFGMAGITVDLGRAYAAYRDLQSSTDAAALAGAYALALPTSKTTAAVDTLVHAYGSESGQANASHNLPGALLTTSYKCVADNSAMVPVPCTAYPTGYNVIQVMQTSPVPMYFIRALSLFGINSAKSITLRSYATATTGGTPIQMNIAIVLDSTASMAQTDSACGKNVTKEECAEGGVQTLLSELMPCAPGTSPCSPFDSVCLFTFPNIAANSTGADAKCTGSPSILGYTAPTVPTIPTGPNSWVPPTGSTGTYQLTGFLNDYSSNNQLGGTISSTSQLGMATGAGSCSGIVAKGGEGTYLAGAIYAAQSALMSQSYNTTTRRMS